MLLVKLETDLLHREIVNQRINHTLGDFVAESVIVPAES